MENGVSFIVLSYIPLLCGAAGETVDVSKPDRVADLISYVNSLPDGCAEGCVWVLDKDGSPYPVLIMPSAKEIADHLVMWAEGSPSEWFDLHIRVRGEKYALALVPKIYKSVERFEIAYQLRNGFPIPEDSHNTILFKPLHFCAGSSSTFHKVEKNIGRKVQVGLIDPDDLPSDYLLVEDSAIRILGTFHVGSNSEADRHMVDLYMDKLLDGIC